VLNLSLGKAGETVAGKFLLASGFSILDKNYKCYLGEIDLIATRRDVLYFTEVKTRTSLTHGWPAESVTLRKQNKLRKLALYYLSAQAYRGPVAFGVVEVLYNPWRRRYQVNFIPDAF